MRNQQLKDDLSDFWDVAKSLVFVLGILLLFIGSVYLKSYLESFGLTLTYIKLELTTYYFYGFYAILFAPCLVSFLLFLLLYALLYYLRNKLVKYYYGAMLLITVLFFVSMYHFSQRYGKSQADKILSYKNVTRIHINFSKDFSMRDSVSQNALLSSNLNNSLFFLLDNGDEIVVLMDQTKNKPQMNNFFTTVVEKNTFYNYYLIINKPK